MFKNAGFIKAKRKDGFDNTLFLHFAILATKVVNYKLLHSSLGQVLLSKTTTDINNMTRSGASKMGGHHIGTSHDAYFFQRDSFVWKLMEVLQLIVLYRQLYENYRILDRILTPFPHFLTHLNRENVYIPIKQIRNCYILKGTDKN